MFAPSGSARRSGGRPKCEKRRAGRLAPVRLADRRVFGFNWLSLLLLRRVGHAYGPVASERDNSKLPLAHDFDAMRLPVGTADELADGVPYVLHRITPPPLSRRGTSDMQGSRTSRLAKTQWSGCAGSRGYASASIIVPRRRIEGEESIDDCGQVISGRLHLVLNQLGYLS